MKSLNSIKLTLTGSEEAKSTRLQITQLKDQIKVIRQDPTKRDMRIPVNFKAAEDITSGLLEVNVNLRVLEGSDKKILAAEYQGLISEWKEVESISNFREVSNLPKLAKLSEEDKDAGFSNHPITAAAKSNFQESTNEKPELKRTQSESAALGSAKNIESPTQRSQSVSDFRSQKSSPSSFGSQLDIEFADADENEELKDNVFEDPADKSTTNADENKDDVSKK